jgi:hypothetical protein
MSKLSEPGTALNAATRQEGLAESGEAANYPKMSVYAPYYPGEESRIPGSYLVSFQPGHTLAKHFTFLGFDFEPAGRLENGYYATLDDQVFNAVRYDPGVKAVEDDCFGEEE